MTGRPIETDRIAHARIVTRSKTFVKHEFRLGDGTAEVRRNGQILVALTNVQATSVAGAHRVEGANADGLPEVWNVDNLGCGCRNIPQILDTDERQIPV